ncbi:MAG: fused MFS/spermidine synthase [Casimicrobiaceae bacterium]
MTFYATTIFLSAFLLFLVQPIIAKEILPWFGGSAAVWTTCLVFFQVALLVGYAYADWLVRRVRARRAVQVHALLLVLAVLMLPIIPAAHWKPLGTENPSWLILGLMLATIGLPYFVLSSTSPLMQAWFAQRFPQRSPYRLFALSNFASLLALIGYPFIIEPWVATHVQAAAWSWAFAAFAVLCIGTGVFTLRSLGAAARGAPFLMPSAQATAREPAPSAARQTLWVALAATGSLLLLAVTNHITENIAAVPLLWIIPLSIYLVTFILCFDSNRWYRRRLFFVLAAVLLGAMAWTLADDRVTHELALQFGVFCAGLFIACMFCHGELASLKPAPRHLTRFYLLVALGGAVGSTLVGIVAPLILPASFELGFGLAACAFLLALRTRGTPAIFGTLAGAALVMTIGAEGYAIHTFYASTIYATRNFYGVLRVQETGSGPTLRRLLVHGTILHGNQYLSPPLAREPSTYYTRTSGIGLLLETMNPSLTPLKVGVIGLGAGTLAVYGAKGDVFRIYDINPAVIRIAHQYFTYLADSDATIETPLGDARLNLEREPSQQFDVLAIDAFSSDAIPVHLITFEAISIYLRHMKADGVIAFHVTNRFLDLVPVVDELAKAHKLRAVWIADDGDIGELGSRSDWVLVSASNRYLDRPRIAEHATPIVAHDDWRLWTDDFNNLIQVFKH